MNTPQSILIVDEIPGRIVGNDDHPPGRIIHLKSNRQTIWENSTLKMPYDAVPLPYEHYLVNLIREKAVCKIDLSGTIKSTFKVGGYPCSLQLLHNGNFLVAGWDYHLPGFVREFNPIGETVWQSENLGWPWKGERLQNGNTLIADAKHNRVFEVNVAGEEVWAIEGIGPASPDLFDHLGPVYCQRLSNQNTLISIRGLSKIIEVDPSGKIVWQVKKPIVSNQYSAIRLKDGNTLIADCGHHRVIVIDQKHNIVWEEGGFGYPAKAYFIN